MGTKGTHVDRGFRVIGPPAVRPLAHTRETSGIRPCGARVLGNRLKRCKIHKKKKTSALCVRCYWANTERKEVFSLAQLFTRNLHMGLANSWETSRRAIRPCTASSVLCGLAVSISRALCSAIRWFLSMMPLVPNFLALLVLPSLKSTRDTLRGVLTTLCLKPQVIAKRQLHSYIPSPADDAPSPRPRYAGRRAYRSVPGPCELCRTPQDEVRRIPFHALR